VIARPVIGLIASSTAFGGIYGVIIILALMIFICSFLVIILADHLENSAWAIFITASMLQIAGEREPSAILGLGGREIPIIIACAGIVVWIYTHLLSSSRVAGLNFQKFLEIG
jgi:hypothetical protein